MRWKNWPGLQSYTENGASKHDVRMMEKAGIPRRGFRLLFHTRTVQIQIEISCAIR